MKKEIIICIVLLFSNTLYAQKIFIPFLNVNNSAPMYEKNKISWSFGETVFTQTLVHPSGFILTGGLIQPHIINNNGNTTIAISSVKILIGPNPIHDHLNIFCNQLGIMIESIQITDAFGQIKQIINGPYSGVNFKMQTPFISVNTGIYFVVIHYFGENKISNIKTYKIIKT